MKSFKLFCPVVICTFTFFFSNCKKDKTTPSDNPYGLPNATQNGDYGGAMMACRINDVNQIANKNVTAGISFSKDTLGIDGIFAHQYAQQIDFGLIVKNKQTNIQYSLSDTTATIFYYRTDSTCLGGSPDLITVEKATGFINFTKIDTSNRILSGTFNCRIPIPNCDTINVTYGRFDMTYQ